MSHFLEVFQSRESMLWEKIWEHLQISIISLLIAVIIAVPLGIALTRSKRLAEPIIGITAVLQTIPSLAVLAFLIPFLGIGRQPAVVALIAYGLLPILRNTYTGIKEVNPALKEAATGMGMNSLRRLAKVELPLAMPVIMAGIRTSMVLIVGTTTIAALIGAGGLGELILLGIDRGGEINLILLGAIPAALLAVLLDFILRVVERTSVKAGFRSLAAVMVAAVLIIVSPFLINMEQRTDLVIGGKLNAEPSILINMYKILIEEETDLKVELEEGLGKTAFVFSALQEGSIDIYPEFTGTAIVTHLEEQAVSNDAREVYEQAKEGMKEQYDMAFLEPMAYNNTYTLATTHGFAEANDLETISDLKTIDDEVTAGFTLEFNDREDGYQGIQKLYGIEFGEVRTMEPGIRQGAIANGQVDIIDAYSTDSYMVELDLKALEDDKNLFPPYQGAPLMRQETLDRYPELEGILNQLAGKITDEQMREMNYQVDYEEKSYEEVARKFLKEQELIN
ncbi:ABC transporter permease/substrate-binding protein [Sediminibacillus halophilus]|uniref:Osmoprotectant transport system permease protein n=1 Tax=Sediminibacillus halophilus TaxID=482461 RepID=A0A1G9M8P4_9BACI|nr:ABC transporter permease/substrate-binding protein [Sediminibacillus halophilus]SDL70608.1 osmoprotectant transport system permease protein [Sediminibacillus halophilus]